MSHGFGYVQVRLGSDPLWFETGTVQFHVGSPLQVDPFGTRWQI